jgi:hypothetical protein
MHIAIITDQHWGVRNDNKILLNHQKDFYKNTFFPTIRDRGITQILDLGDSFDKRKHVNFVTLQEAKKSFYNKIAEYEMTMDCIIGNHTTYYKNTNSVNTMVELFDNENHLNIHWEKPVELNFDGLKVLLCPWICDENYDVSIKAIQETDAQILMGHFEIQGFEMYRGAVNHHGMDKNIFSKFDMVLSGHFHHKSSYGNIHYLGAPYQMTWSDYDDPRGFHILDTETRQLEFIPNNDVMFHKLWYDDRTMSANDITDLNFNANLKDSYVKVIVKQKTNPYLFDLYMTKLQEMGCADIKSVEDHMNLDLVDEDSIINEAEDTITILEKYVNSLDITHHKDRIDNIVKALYHEAANL